MDPRVLEVDPRVLEALEQNGKMWILELTNYAAIMVTPKSWRGNHGGHLAKDYDVADLVLEAFQKVLSGEHQWNPERQPDLFQFLKDVINRLISNISRSRDNQNVSLVDDEPMNALEDEPTDNMTEEEERVMEDIRKLAKERHDVRKIFDAITEGRVDGKGDLAAETGLAKNEVYNAFRHIRRHVQPPRQRS